MLPVQFNPAIAEQCFLLELLDITPYNRNIHKQYLLGAAPILLITRGAAVSNPAEKNITTYNYRPIRTLPATAVFAGLYRQILLSPRF